MLAVSAYLNTITMSRWARLDTGQSSARLVLFEMSRHPSIADKPILQQARVSAPLAPGAVRVVQADKLVHACI